MLPAKQVAWRGGFVSLPDTRRSVMPTKEVPDDLREQEPETPVSLPELPDVADEISTEERSRRDPSSELPLPRWLFNLIGHVLAAVLGLILGYLILALLRPLTFPLPWYH